MGIRVLIADDHPVVRDGLRLTIERDADDVLIVGEAEDGEEAVRLGHRLRPDVYVLDITMPNLNGIDAARRILRADPGARIIILSLHDSRTLVEEALDTGACGYLVKESATRDIIQAVREVHAGRVFLSPGVARFVVDTFVDRRAAAPGEAGALRLTPRERQVLQLIAEGLTSKEIAARLELAANTVHVHRTNLMSKLDLHKQTDLVRYAVKHGIAKL